jgi:hypothetical protein
VDFATADGTATVADSDYIAASDTLTFGPGETEKTVTVRVKGDRTAEPDETFFVNLTNATGGATILDTQGVGTILNDDGDPLMASFGEQVGASALSLPQAQQITTLAVALWSTGSPWAMPQVNVAIEDLPPGQLGEAFGSTITLDINANGAGWYTDLTTPQAGRVDLLTVVAHEIGHLLGYGHSDDSQDLMAATLPEGTRRLPGLGAIAVGSDMVELPPNLDFGTGTTKVELPITESPADMIAQTDLNLLLQPLVTDHVQQLTSSPKAAEARTLDDLLDDETELVDEELLALVLGK